MLATLLSIILVVGLSPLGKAPTRAWAASGDTYNSYATGQDVIAAPMVDKDSSSDVAPANYYESGVKVADKVGTNPAVYEVTMTADGVPAHNNEYKKLYWVGIGIPYVNTSTDVNDPHDFYDFECGFGKYDSKKSYDFEDDADFQMGENGAAGSAYSTFYFNSASAGDDGFFVAVADADEHNVVAVYNVDTKKVVEKSTVTANAVTGSGSYKVEGTSNDTAYANITSTQVNSATAKNGQTVTVTATPTDSSNKVKSVAVTATKPGTSETYAVPVAGGGSTYTFTMPAAAVAIDVAFEAVGVDKSPTKLASSNFYANGYYYKTFADVQSDVAAGDTIQLVKPWSIKTKDTDTGSAKVTKAVTIDLNGQALTIAPDGTVAAATNGSLIVGAAGATITDSLGTGSIAANAAKSIAVAAGGKLAVDTVAITGGSNVNIFDVAAGAELDIESGKVEAKGTGVPVTTAGKLVVGVAADPENDIEAGIPELKAETGAVLALAGTGATDTTTIVDGSLTTGGDYAVTVVAGHQATISGGEFYGKKSAVQAANSAGSATKLEISGGVFDYEKSADDVKEGADKSGNAALDLGTATDVTASYYLSGGEFKGVAFKTPANSNETVAGGVFHEAVADALLSKKIAFDATAISSTPFAAVADEEAGTWKVEKSLASLAVSDVTVNGGTPLTYTGEDLDPKVSVKWPTGATGTALDEDEFTCAFYATSEAAEAAAAGTAVTPKDAATYYLRVDAAAEGFTGHKVVSVPVGKASLDSLTEDGGLVVKVRDNKGQMTQIPSNTDTTTVNVDYVAGEQVKPAYEITLNGTPLEVKVTYGANDKAGTGTIKFDAADDPAAKNISSTSGLTYSFTIVGRSIDKQYASWSAPAPVTFDNAQHLPNLSAINPSIANGSILLNGTTNVSGTDKPNCDVFYAAPGVEVENAVAYNAGSIAGTEFVKAGKYKIVYRPTSDNPANLSGELVIDYVISPKPLDKTAVSFYSDERAWHGTPLPTVQSVSSGIAGYPMAIGVDYNVDYPTVDAAGSHKVTVDFTGNFSGSVTGDVPVSQGTFEAAVATGPTGSGATVGKTAYTGDVIDGAAVFGYKFKESATDTATISLTSDDYEVKYYLQNADGTETLSELKEAGTYKAKFTGAGSFKAASTAEVTVTVEPASLSAAKSVNIAFNEEATEGIVYDGTAIDPNEYLADDLTITFGDEATALSKDDINVVADAPVLNNSNPDAVFRTYTGFTVYGNEKNLSGSTHVSVADGIVEKALPFEDYVTVELPEGLVYNGEDQSAATKAGIVVKHGDEPLTIATDYTVAFKQTIGNDGEEITASNPTIVKDAGTYEVTVTPTNAMLSGTVVKGLEVAKFNIENAAVPAWGTINAPAFTAATFDGTEQAPALSEALKLDQKLDGKDGTGADTLKQDTDFTIAEKFTRAGKYTGLTLEGKGNLEGEYAAEDWEFTIGQVTAAATDLTILYDIDGTKTTYAEKFTGGPDQKPNVKVLYGSTAKFELTEGKDYSVAYDNYATGSSLTPTVTVTVLAGEESNFNNSTTTTKTSATGDWTIGTTDISGATMTLGEDQPLEVTFSGESVTITPVVTTTRTLSQASDYNLLVKAPDSETAKAAPEAGDNWTLSSGVWTGVLQAGTYEFVAQGKGSSYGVKKVSLKVNPFDISGAAKIEVMGGTSYTYTGQAVSPTAIKTATFDLGTDKLNAAAGDVDSNFEATVEGDNVNAGTFDVVVKPVEAAANFTGSSKVSIKINPAAFASAYTIYPKEYTVDEDGKYAFKDTWTYEGKKIEPEVVVVKDSDVAAYAAANATANPTADIVKAIVEGEIPALTDENVAVAYGDNIDVAYEGLEVVALAKGLQNYMGATSEKFHIGQVAFEDAVVEAPAQTFDGTEKKPLTVSTAGGAKLAEGKDYYVSYENNTQVGTATANLVSLGAGNLAEGEKKVDFEIQKAVQEISVPASVDVVAGQQASFDVSGAQGAVGASVTAGSDKATISLVGSRVTVTGVAAGQATVTVTAGETDGYQAAAPKTVAVNVTAPAPEPPAPVVKSANSYKVTKAKTATVKYKKLKKKAQTLAINKVLTEVKGQGAMTYTVTKVKKGKKAVKKANFKINKTSGKITVKKKLAKGTYKVTLTAKAAGDDTHEASAKVTKTVTVKVK